MEDAMQRRRLFYNLLLFMFLVYLTWLSSFSRDPRVAPEPKVTQDLLAHVVSAAWLDPRDPQAGLEIP